MKNKLLLLTWMFAAPSLWALEPIGSIHIADGGTIRFYEILEIEAWTEAGGTWEYFRKGAWTVDYKGTTTHIPYDKLKTVEILAPKFSKDGKMDADVKVITKTGASVTCKQALHYMNIRMFNELTGEIKIQQVNFQRGKKLNIAKITFD